jgi:hypothetical protein
MAEATGIDKIVEQIVSQVLETHVPHLKDELVRRVLEELPAHMPAAAPGGSSGAGAADLLHVVSSIHAGTTQKEILRSLLDSTSHYSRRAALFVVKGGAAVGWQGQGFANSDDIKDFVLDVNHGAVAEALHSRSAAPGNAANFDSHFISQFGAPTDGQLVVLPLLVKDKIAALVYADSGGENGSLDPVALELVVAATGAWLEVVSLRKLSQRDGTDHDAGGRQDPVPVQTVSSYSDPFAGHAPAYSAGTPAPAAAAASAGAGAGQAGVAALSASPQLSLEDADLHRKAQRFARLLVDEIKLYNQVKVTEGRKNRDLYDRLREDIEKGRSMYLKRYGNTAAAGADYFSSELVRSLAEDDPSLMGANFRK